MFGVHRDRVKAGEAQALQDSASGVSARRASKRRISTQRIVQLISAVLLNGYVIGFQKGAIFTGGTKAVCVPVLNCYSCPGALGACPIGSLQVSLGGTVHRHFPFYVLGTLMLFGVVLGRLVCGMLCPFGLIQDLIAKIPVRKIKVPRKVDRPARYVKYVVLVVMVILLPAFAVSSSGVNPPFFCKYLCPAGTLEGGITNVILNSGLRKVVGVLFDWKVLVLVLIVVASIFIHRPFCKYLCPLGAFYSLFNRFSFYQMHVDKDRCIGCRRCERVCPMGVEVTKDINSAECIRCGRCRMECPAHAIAAGFSLRGLAQEGATSDDAAPKPGETASGGTVPTTMASSDKV